MVVSVLADAQDGLTQRYARQEQTPFKDLRRDDDRGQKRATEVCKTWDVSSSQNALYIDSLMPCSRWVSTKGKLCLKE